MCWQKNSYTWRATSDRSMPSIPLLFLWAIGLNLLSVAAHWKNDVRVRDTLVARGCICNLTTVSDWMTAEMKVEERLQCVACRDIEIDQSQHAFYVSPLLSATPLTLLPSEHEKHACCNNTNIGLALYQSCRFGSYAELRFCMTHAYTSRMLFPLPQNASFRLCTSVRQSHDNFGV